MNAHTLPPSDQASDRALPHNVEAEQAVLGAILMNNATWHTIGARLHADHFSEEIHRHIWSVVSDLIRGGRVASPVTVKTFLGDHELGDGVSVSRYLARLITEATPALNVPDHAVLIADLHVRRELIAITTELREQSFDPPASIPVERLIEGAETALMDLRIRGLTHAVTSRISAGDAAADLLADVDRIRAGEVAGMGVTTGIPSIDKDTGGMRPGDLWIVAGRVAMGKSIKAISLARAAARSGAGTLLFPFEIGRRQAVARILSDLAYDHRKPLGYGRILKGDVDDEDRWRLDEARERLAGMPMVFDDADGATLAQIAARTRSERERMRKGGYSLGVVILDYLNFIKASDRYQGQRHNEIGEISIGLKRMAKDLGVCVVLLAQVNRQTESRDDKRPQLADLKDSGSLESDADVVAFMYRESYYIERSAAYLRGDPEATALAVNARNEIEVIVGKNRTGPTRSHKLWCDVPCSIISARSRSGF